MRTTDDDARKNTQWRSESRESTQDAPQLMLMATNGNRFNYGCPLSDRGLSVAIIAAFSPSSAFALVRSRAHSLSTRFRCFEHFCNILVDLDRAGPSLSGQARLQSRFSFLCCLSFPFQLRECNARAYHSKIFSESRCLRRGFLSRGHLPDASAAHDNS